MSTVSPSICHEVTGPDAIILIFWILSFKSTFSLSSFTFIKRFFSSPSLSAIKVVSSAYLRLLIFLLEILIPACTFSSPAFLMIYPAYKFNKQGDNILPWCTPFLIWNQSVVPYPVLTVASWPAYRFLKRQVRWFGIPISWRIFHSLLWFTQSKVFGIVNKAEIDVFLELYCFLDDPVDVGNLISGSSASSKTSLNIWKFSVHILVKPGLENFEHYFTSMWNECNCAVVWAVFGIAFLRDWNEIWPLPVLWPLLSFQICWHIECSTFTASLFRIWPLDLVHSFWFSMITVSQRISRAQLEFEIAQLEFHRFIPSDAFFFFFVVTVMLLKAHLTSYSRMSGSRWVITPLWLSGSWRSFFFFFYSSSVYSCHFFLISSASVRSIPFLSFI